MKIFNKPYMKVILLVILTVLLFMLTAGITVITLTNLHRTEIEFSGTFI